MNDGQRLTETCCPIKFI